MADGKDSGVPAIKATHLARKDSLAMALILRPLEDYMLLGHWSNPQILFDLSRDEVSFSQTMVDMMRKVIDAHPEEMLCALLAQKIMAHGLAGDPRLMLYQLPR